MKNQSEETLADAKKGGSEKKNIIKASIATGAAGAALGVAAVAGIQAAHAATNDDPQDAKNEENANGEANATPEAQNHDEMSFDEAFAAARNEVGAGGIFRWHGRYYGTYTKDEWQNMSQAEKDDYAQRLPDKVQEAEDSWQQGHSTARVVHDHPHVAATTHSTDETNTGGGNTPTNDTHVDPTPAQNRVQVLDVRVEQVDDGQQAIVADLKIDGHDAQMLDANMDGKMDVMGIDLNDNGQFDNGEMGRIDSQNIRVEDLQAMQGGGATGGPLLAQDPNLPDYTNDGDVSYLA